MQTDAKSVVLGGRGMLGVDLVTAIETEGALAPVLAADRPEVDITDEDALRRFLEGVRPAVVFNCAGLADVDGCESRRDAAFVVNASGAGNAAAAARALGARFIHISTDYVFDGAKRSAYVEEDKPAPLSVYGRSKLEGERLVAERGGDWVVARTAWMFGEHGANFLDMMLSLARQRSEVKVVAEPVGSPTWSRDLADALIALARGAWQGVFHAVNAGACSRVDWVREIVAAAGLDTRVTPVDSSAFPRPARVPAYSALSIEKLRRETGHVMRPWRDAVREFVRARVTERTS